MYNPNLAGSNRTPWEWPSGFFTTHARPRRAKLAWMVAFFLVLGATWTDSVSAQAMKPTAAAPRPNLSVRSVRERLAQRVAPQTSQSDADSQPFAEFPLPDANAAPNGDEAPEASREIRVPLRTPDLERIRLKAEDGLISLVTRDSRLSDVITVLAETQGLNVVASDPLNVPITITLDRVDLTDALEAILSVSGFTWSRQKDIIFITNLNGTNQVAPHAQGLRTEVFALDFALAQDVNAAVTGMVSPLGHSFVMTSNSAEVRQSREVVVVQDLPGYLDLIRDYIAQVDVPPRQVLIEVHVLQVDLDAKNKNGVNFDQLFRRNGNLLLEMHTTGFASATPNQAFTFRFSDGNLTSFLEWLRTTTDAKTLASPRILALNGQLSRIQVGEQLGFRVTTTTETSTTESVDFLDVGVVLEVTPRISRDGRIMLSVRPEVSSGRVNPDTGLPEEKTTELDTDVLLCDNEGVVIGGLIQESDSDLQSKLPWLGDLYLVGRLFQHRDRSKKRTEIIMALVPRLVPYQLPYDQFATEKFMQAHTPLLYGSLESVARPWEPQLPDALERPLTWQLPRLCPFTPWDSCDPACDPCGNFSETGMEPSFGDGPLYFAPSEPPLPVPSPVEEGTATPALPLPEKLPESSHLSPPSVHVSARPSRVPVDTSNTNGMGRFYRLPPTTPSPPDVAPLFHRESGTILR